MLFIYFFFFFKQKTAYEMRISDWSSDVCSSDLVIEEFAMAEAIAAARLAEQIRRVAHAFHAAGDDHVGAACRERVMCHHHGLHARAADFVDGRADDAVGQAGAARSLARDRKSTRLNSSH